MTRDDIKCNMTSYLQDVFKYFNGLVNPINKNINLVISDKSSIINNRIVMGHMFFGTIVIYLDSSIEYYGKECDGESLLTLLKYELTYSLIHELYHCDQCIDILRYRDRGGYYNDIETNAEYKTIVYIENNHDLIRRKLGLVYTDDMLQYYRVRRDMGRYVDVPPFNWLYYYRNLLEWNLQDKDAVNKIVTDYDNITIVMDDNIYEIKLDGQFVPTSKELNTDYYNILAHDHSINIGVMSQTVYIIFESI